MKVFKFADEKQLTQEQKQVQKDLNEFVLKDVFSNLILEAKKSENENALIKAIEENKIFYTTDQIFTGDFNVRIISAIRNIGGIYKPKLQGYYIPVDNLDNQLKSLLRDKQQERQNTYTSLLQNIDKNLEKIMQNGFIAFANVVPAVKIIEKLTKHFSAVDKEPEVSYITKQIEEQAFIKKYTKNIDLSIKGVAESELVRLRNDIVKAQQEGATITNIESLINNKIDVSKTRAEFIAKQETRLFASTYQQTLSKQKGLTKFRWIHTDPRGARTEPRKGHIMLFERSNKGEIFDFNNPPTDPITKKATLPGEEFNCNCLAGIVLE